MRAIAHPTSGSTRRPPAAPAGRGFRASPLPGILLAALLAGPSRASVIINEIHYHPASDSADEEFIELYNTASIPIDLAGWTFSDGISYVFPEEAVVAPGGFVVVARHQPTFELIHGAVPGLYGDFEGRLDNGGERIALADAGGRLVDEVTYDDALPWPRRADGLGPSLELRFPSLDNSRSESWLASAEAEGTPGRVNSIYSFPQDAVLINEVAVFADGTGWIEIHNRSEISINLRGYYLAFDSTPRPGIPIDESIDLEAGGFAVITSELFGPRLNPSGGSVTLIYSAGEIIFDVLPYPPLTPEISAGRYPDGTSHITVLDTPSPGSPNRLQIEDRIAINEISYHPPGFRDDEDWIELFNRGAEPVAIGGWRFTQGVSFTFPAGTSVEPGAYLLVVASAAQMAAAYGDLPVAGEFEGRLANEGESIQLVDNYGRVIRSLTYSDAGDWPQQADGEGSSLELLNPALDPGIPGFWRASAPATSEWTEVEIGSLTFHVGTRLFFTLEDAGQMLLDDVRIVTAQGVDVAVNGGLEENAPPWTAIGNHEASCVITNHAWAGTRSLHLIASGGGDNRGNCVEMPAPSLGASTTLTLRARARWLAGGPTLQMWTNDVGSFGRSPRQPPMAWANVTPAPCGSPGRANSRRVANAPPAIGAVNHAPPVPAPGATAVVRATVHDDEPDPPELALLWRLREATGLQTGTMNDAGLPPDTTAADQIYAGTIPAQASGAIVEYWLLATGGDGQQTLDPAPYPQRSKLLRFAPPEQDLGMPQIHVLMSRQNTTELETRDIFHDGLLDATVLCGTQIFHHAGIRYRGNTTRTRTPRPYRIDLGKDRSLFGLIELNLNSFRPAPQVLNYDLHRRAGAVAPWAGSVFVCVNGGMLQHYALVEPVDNDFLEDAYPDDDPMQSLYRSATRAVRRNRWEDPSLAELLQPLAIDQSIRYHAIQAVSAAYDTYWQGNAEDVYIYRRAAESAFHLIPWDSDLAFQAPAYPLYGRANRPVLIQYADRYYQNIIQLMEGPFSIETMQERIQALYGATPVDTAAELAFVTNRHAFLNERVTLAVTSSVTTTNLPVARCSGRTPRYWTWQLTANGAPDGLSFAYGVEEWSAAVPLAGPGPQQVLVQAWDSKGIAFQSATFQVDVDAAADADGDDMPDWWEFRHGFPWQAEQPEGEATAAAADADGDDTDNLAEYLGGSDPLDPASRLTIVSLRAVPGSGAADLTWTSASHALYQVWYRDLARDGAAGAWLPLGPPRSGAPQSPTSTLRDDGALAGNVPPGAPELAARFYAVQALAQ